MSTDVSPDFMAAMIAAMDDHEQLGSINSGDWQENGAMRAVGIARADSLRFATVLQETYGQGLATGWDCPECGRLCDEDGDCPEGHEYNRRSPDAGRLETLLAVAELCLAVGVHLERARASLFAS